MDHKHVVSAGEFSANFEAAVSKAFREEILSAISTQIDEEVDARIERSPFVTMLADESTCTYIANTLTVYVRIIDPKTSVAETIYSRDVEYEDGTVEGLAQEILNEAPKRKIPPSKMIGFGSDGARVMTRENTCER